MKTRGFLGRLVAVFAGSVMLLTNVPAVNADGQFFVKVRYDLPESMNSMVLVPTGSGIDYKAQIAAGETPKHENEDIVLLK